MNLAFRIHKCPYVLKQVILCILCCFCFYSSVNAQYHTLWIPDTLNGTTFNLTVKDTFKQVLPGQQTISAGVNGNNIWGPTLIWNKGDTVHLNVTNKMNDSTTMHWHGIHLTPIMDGGPHQVIPQNTTWSPYFKVKNNAATYWYHPHLHMHTMEQLNMGLGGLIIIRDSIESALALPRKYGVDDIPLILTDRRFDTDNQFVKSLYGDTMFANFTLNPQYNLPAQIVRIRILNTATERFYNLGFGDNRQFYAIATDGGLLNTPVQGTRKLLAPDERVEILVNFIGQSGQSFDLKAYNASLPGDMPGYQTINAGNVNFRNILGGRDFNIVHFNIVAQTVNPVTVIPASLTTNAFWNSADATVTRTVTMTNGGSTCPPDAAGCYLLNNKLYDANRIDYQSKLNNLEVWELTNTSNLAHPFHIHDAQFYIFSSNGALAAAVDRGWKDVVVVRKNATIKIVMKFSDYADTMHPYMFHCHLASHEDQGMMGQFLVQPACIPAAITSYSPTAIAPGAIVSIIGSGFNMVSSVKFNSINAVYTVNDSNHITATVPSGISPGSLSTTTDCNTATAKTNYTISNSSKLTLHLFLEGLYIGGGMMRGISETVADTITVKLYSTTNLSYPDFSTKVTLSTTGVASAVFPASAIGHTYWICIRHRNSIETWSKYPIMLLDAAAFSFKN